MWSRTTSVVTKDLAVSPFPMTSTDMLRPCTNSWMTGSSPSLLTVSKPLSMSCWLNATDTPMLPLCEDGLTITGNPHSGHGCGSGTPTEDMTSLDLLLEQETP